jgi:hypothetical protein
VQTLLARAGDIAVHDVVLPDGARVPVRAIRVRFGRATPERLKPGTLPPPYASKRLVSVEGDAMFGELAVVRWLERDGWDAVWADVAQGRKFWRAMPHRSAPVALPPALQARWDAIVDANGGSARGAFDVLAWRGAQVAFLEYRGPGERAARGEGAWVAAALRAGVSPHDLWIVRCGEPDDDG